MMTAPPPLDPGPAPAPPVGGGGAGARGRRCVRQIVLLGGRYAWAVTSEHPEHGWPAVRVPSEYEVRPGRARVVVVARSAPRATRAGRPSRAILSLFSLRRRIRSFIHSSRSLVFLDPSSRLSSFARRP
jgi:hypothetical protein